MKAIILCGGEATRLRPLSYTLPKILFPIKKNKPLCFYHIEWLKKYNIKELVFALGYLGDKVKQALGNGSKFGIKISYAYEDVPLDTAGAIRNAAVKINEKDSFLVLNGDILTSINLSSLINFHKQKRSQLTLCLKEVEKEVETYGLVICDRGGRFKSFLEKPDIKNIKLPSKRRLINAGIYVFEPELIEEIPSGTRYSFEKEFVPSIIKKNFNVFGFVAKGYWQEMGTYSRYFQAKKDINKLKF